MSNPATISPAEARLLRASFQAAAAYRAIFGQSCWNSRDRRAFEELDRAIVAYAAEKDLLGEEMVRLLANEGVPPIIALPPTTLE